MPMRKLALFSLLAVIACAVIYLYRRPVLDRIGDVLTRRHQVARFSWKVPTDSALDLSDPMAFEAVKRALATNFHDAGDWKPVPNLTESEPHTLRKGTDANRGLIILTNQNSPSKLFATVELI